MRTFFESLSFKQKIVVGFTVLSSILILGMAYMLIEFSHVASLVTNIIQQQQPVTNTASKALKDAQSASNQIHKFMLTDSEVELSDYHATMKRLQSGIQTLSFYAEDSDLVINKQHLKRSVEIIDDLNSLTEEIIRLNDNYEENHPIITTASSLLNPPALEYLGLINLMLVDNAADGLSTDALMLLADMRHSWSQVMSHLRIALATRALNELVNVRAYVVVNTEQTERLKAMELDLGFEGIESLSYVRNEYLKNLDNIIEMFNTSIWRRTSYIMATSIMPLYDELESYLNEITSIQLNNTKAASKSLATVLLKTRYIFIAMICIGLIFAVLFSVFISRSLRKPLKRLVVATRAVAMGNLDTKIETTGNDEIAQLNHSFNDMVDNLNESQTELLKALNNAKDANETKTRFLSSMSHELRTPLNAILGFSQLLEMDLNNQQTSGKSKMDHLDFARKIQNSGHHLLDLINGVLDLSRIEEGHLNIQLKPVNVHESVHECIAQIEASLTTNQHITLIDQTDEFISYVLADHQRLRQVLINLISNAVKYNKEGGSVTIEYRHMADNTARISITDTGNGIAEQDIDKLFDPFERLAFSHGSIEGTGIGLTVTQQLIEAMGGTIGVDSVPGEGSTFWFELPVSNPETDSELIHSVTSGNQTTSESISQTVLKNKVLYIEDNCESRQLVIEALSHLANIEVISAITAEEGLVIAEQQLPDIILMDINLPGIDGFEALKTLRNNEQTRHIPVIAISANAKNEDIQKGRQAGFNEYLTKPIDINELFSLLKRL